MQPMPRHLALSAILLAAALATGSTPEMIDRPMRLPSITDSTAPGDALSVQRVDSQPSNPPQPYLTPERLDRGYTLVVVGVNGDNSLSAGLAPGLATGGYPGAVEVIDWTTGFWPLFVYHLRAHERHRTWAKLTADKIVAYQARYPGRPVNLLGYSAGAVVAVETLAALPAGREIDRAVLLAGAISPLYDLRAALARTRFGIWSYYQPQDAVALWAGTVVVGTADGTHIVSAGAVGFWTPLGLSADERQLYREKLVQLPYKPQMALTGNFGGHFQCVNRAFVAQWIAPVLIGSPEPSLAQDPRRKVQ
jgi:pimeloyl-ACP methyl ester carboxylesterase